MEELKNLKHSGLVSIKLTGATGSCIDESIDEAIKLALELDTNVIIEINGEYLQANPNKIRESIKVLPKNQIG